MSLAWRVELDEDARRELHRPGAGAAERITRYLRERLATTDDPRRFGHPLRGDHHGLWRYRMVADYRILARIEEQRLLVLVVRIGHRKDAYDS